MKHLGLFLLSFSLVTMLTHAGLSTIASIAIGVPTTLVITACIFAYANKGDTMPEELQDLIQVVLECEQERCTAQLSGLETGWEHPCTHTAWNRVLAVTQRLVDTPRTPCPQRCEACHDTGFYGDNGPGVKGNAEWHECDQCTVSDRCRRTHSQDCGNCDDLTCCDNQNQKSETNDEANADD